MELTVVIGSLSDNAFRPLHCLDHRSNLKTAAILDDLVDFFVEDIGAMLFAVAQQSVGRGSQRVC